METNGEVDWGESVGTAKQDRREKARRSTKGWNSSWMLVVRDGKAIVKKVTTGWGSGQMDSKGVPRTSDRRGAGLGAHDQGSSKFDGQIDDNNVE